MRIETAFVFPFLAVCTAVSASPEAPLSVVEVIQHSQSLVGKRVIVEGIISECQPLSCGLEGLGEDGRKRYLSLERDDGFDDSVRSLAGRSVRIEATVTDTCMPNIDPDVIVMCTDRPPTLVSPALKSITR
ncbi:MAG: hypothetical protein IBJ13_15160 [Sphingopyxis sp.]|nr:hypothetical protein [Sphingopyxis sp.]